MKKISILITAAMVLIFIMPAFAGKPTPETNQTEIINTSENPVPITTNDQIEVIVVDEPATARTVISANIEVYDAGDYILMTVPPDKKFILTDIVAGIKEPSRPRFFVKEDSVWKILVTFDSFDGSSHSINLTSGIPFSPGANLVISNTVNEGYVYITITGYLLDM